jgi:pimeloyl-ACP methyl ester carboxylesterase
VRIITYDHRGHGQSAGAPTCTYHIGQLGADLAEVLEALNVAGPVTLVGHSMGGMAILAYLALPEAHRRLDPAEVILVATAAGGLAAHGLGRLLGTPATALLAELIERVPEHALRLLARPLCGALARHLGCRPRERAMLTTICAAALASTPVTTAIGFLPALRDYDHTDTLCSVSAHTTVISGGADILTPPAQARELVAGITDATHIDVPGAGHMLPHEAPHAINAAIARALSPAAEPAAVGA